MLLRTKIKQKNLQICIDHTPSCKNFCKRNVRKKGRGPSTFSFTIAIISGTGKFFLQGFDISQQTISLKHDRL